MQFSTTSTEWVPIDPSLIVTLNTTGYTVSYALGGRFEKIGYDETVAEITVEINGKMLMDDHTRSQFPVYGITPTTYWIPLKLTAGEFKITPYWRVKSGIGIELYDPRVEAYETVINHSHF